jgi:hypothetical protein
MKGLQHGVKYGMSRMLPCCYYLQGIRTAQTIPEREEDTEDTSFFFFLNKSVVLDQRHNQGKGKPTVICVHDNHDGRLPMGQEKF